MFVKEITGITIAVIESQKKNVDGIDLKQKEGGESIRKL